MPRDGHGREPRASPSRDFRIRATVVEGNLREPRARTRVHALLTLQTFLAGNPRAPRAGSASCLASSLSRSRRRMRVVMRVVARVASCVASSSEASSIAQEIFISRFIAPMRGKDASQAPAKK
jgi:hypothetical protein